MRRPVNEMPPEPSDVTIWNYDGSTRTIQTSQPQPEQRDGNGKGRGGSEGAKGEWAICLRQLWNRCLCVSSVQCCDRCQEVHVLSAGITITKTATTLRRFNLGQVLLVLNARQWMQIWSASATTQKWTSWKAYRENLRFMLTDIIQCGMATIIIMMMSKFVQRKIKIFRCAQ